MEFLTLETVKNIAVMTWRHEQQNRFTTPFIKEILTALLDLENDPTVRGVVITSAHEKFFCTGLHLEWIYKQAVEDSESILELLTLLNQLLITLTGFQKPLIAAINGHVVAAGCIACACMDYRLMRIDKGFIGIPGVKIDLPYWPGMIAIFRDILPSGVFRDMAYTGDRFTSSRAYEMGYIDELYSAEDLVGKAVDLASKLGESNTETYGAVKRANRARVLRIMKEQDTAAIPEDYKRFVARIREA